jgi:hypothetical protein
LFNTHSVFLSSKPLFSISFHYGIALTALAPVW